VACQCRDGQVVPGGQVRIDSGDHALVLELAVQPSLGDNRLTATTHAVGAAGRG
jgi:hypothetical protein